MTHFFTRRPPSARNGCVATFKKRQERDWSSRPGFVSCRRFEQRVDELNLSPNIRTAHPPRLPLPDHVHGLVALDRSPRRDARLDILSDEFLGRVAALEQKNLALETLRKLLNDQIRITERTNIVQSRKFREAPEDAMLRYTNKAITTAEMISWLIDLAKSLRDARRHGEELGLSREETAFYDALAENRSAREAMLSDTLRLMARELTDMVKKMPKLDWTQRESVRASLRRNVRRLLAKYGYPPDLAEGATQLVLRQAELSTENSE